MPVNNADPVFGAVLKARDLTIVFGGLVAVNKLNFEVQRRQIYGIIGPNGAGKTTVFNLITQHYAPTGGDVLLFDESLKGLRPDKVVGRGVSRTFQNIRLFQGLSVRDNILVGMHTRLNVNWIASMFGLGGYGSRVKTMAHRTDELLELVGLTRFAKEPATSLAYGLQRRLEIARALAAEPKLLLLDEPAAGMNPQEVTELSQFILRIRDDSDITILLIEHHMHLVMNICDHIIILNYGEKIAEGCPETVKNDPRVIEAYLGVDKNARC